MKRYDILLLLISTLFIACEENDGIEMSDDEFKVKITDQDTIVLNRSETVFFQNRELLLTFADVVSDSRCPENLICIWGGNAKVQFEIGLDRGKRVFYLNTSGSKHMPREHEVDHISFRLVSLEPYPVHPDKLNIPKEEYKVKISLN